MQTVFGRRCSFRSISYNDVFIEEIIMNVDLVFQIAGIGIVVAVINQLLNRAGRDEMALMVTIAGLVAVLFIVSEQIGELFGTIKRIFGL